MSEKITLGKRLRELRKAKGYTLVQLAEELSRHKDNGRRSHYSHLSRLESDLIRSPRASTIKRLAEALGADAGELLRLAPKGILRRETIRRRLSPPIEQLRRRAKAFRAMVAQTRRGLASDRNGLAKLEQSIREIRGEIDAMSRDVLAVEDELAQLATWLEELSQPEDTEVYNSFRESDAPCASRSDPDDGDGA